MKKLILTFLAALCCMSGFANGTKIDNIYYLLYNTDKTAAVTFTGENYIEESEYTGSIKIPSTVSYNNQVYSVTSIRDNAFYSCSNLTSIIIPSSVTSIGTGVFNGCSSLTSITIPNCVTSIGDYAFYGCSELTSITIPSSVTSIGDYAFCYCSCLTSITIPNGVTSIGNYAFNSCESLTSITIPSCVTSIGDNAFTKCCNLTSLVVFATNPPRLGNNIFGGISNAIPVYVPDVQVYKDWGGFTNFQVWRLEDHKQYALCEIERETQGITGYSYLEELVEGYVNDIKAATDKESVISKKDKLISILPIAIPACKAGKTEGDATGYARGFEEGKAEGKAEAFGGMDTPPLTDCPAVRVTKGDKEVILYAPDAVEMIKVSANK